MSNATAAPNVKSVPVDKIQPSKDNQRSKVGDVDELATSIKSVGVLEPLLVTPNGSGSTYTIVCGHRRHAAAKKAGVTEIPVVIRDDLDERDRNEIQLIENLQREDLSSIDEARAYKKLLDLGFSQRHLADRVGRSQSHISKRVALLELPAAAFKKIDEGVLTVDAAAHLLRLKDLPAKYMNDVLKKASSSRDVKWSVDRAKSEHADELKLAKVRSDLKAKGAKVVDLPGWNSKSKVTKIGKQYGELTTTADKHKDEPCHAIGIRSRYGEIEKGPVCTNPDRHKPKGASKLKAGVRGHSTSAASSSDPEREKKRKAKEREQERRRKQFVNASKERRGFLKSMLQGTVQEEDVFTLLLIEAVSQDNYGGPDLKQILISVGVKTENQVRNWDNAKCVEALCVFAVAKKVNLARVALAIVLDDAEDLLPSSFEVPKMKPGSMKELGDYYEILERHGYQPAEIELELLGRGVPAEGEPAKP